MLLSCDEGIWGSTEDLTLEIFIIWELERGICLLIMSKSNIFKLYTCTFVRHNLWTLTLVHLTIISTALLYIHVSIIIQWLDPTPAQGKVDSRSTKGSQILYIYCSQWYKRKEKGLLSYWQLSCLCLLKYVH